MRLWVTTTDFAWLSRLPRLTKTQGGFNRYTLEDIDSPDAYLAHKHELEKAQDVVLVEYFSDELFGEDVAGGMEEGGGKVQENPRPAAPATETTRFADLSAEDVDKLAEARTSKNTNVQTKWGVKIFRGKINIKCEKLGMTVKEECGLLIDFNYKDVFPVFNLNTWKVEDWMWHIKKNNVCLFTDKYFDTLANVCAVLVAIFKSPAARLREVFPVTRHSPISVPESSTSCRWKLAMKLRNINYKRIDLPNKVVHIVHDTFFWLSPLYWDCFLAESKGNILSCEKLRIPRAAAILRAPIAAGLE